MGFTLFSVRLMCRHYVAIIISPLRGWVAFGYWVLLICRHYVAGSNHKASNIVLRAVKNVTLSVRPLFVAFVIAVVAKEE